MAADASKLRYLASRGHFGHAALLDPDTFVASASSDLGPLVAQNSTNEFGFSDKLKINLDQEQMAPSAANQGAPSIRTKEQADLNERLLRQGFTPQEIMAREQANK